MSNKKIKINKADVIKAEESTGYTIFARAYSLLAYMGVQELLKKIRDKKYKNPLGKIKPDWALEFKFLLAPVFFNFKHSLEIFIKGTARLAEMNFQELHDLKLLFRDIKKKTKQYNIEADLQEAEKIITKYYENQFLHDKINGNFTMEDRFNDLFRYPESKAKAKLYFSFIFPRFKEKDLIDLQQDLKKAYELFYNIGDKILIKRMGGPRANIATREAWMKEFKKKL